MTFAVVKIRQETLDIGTAVTTDCWDDAYEIARGFVLDEIVARDKGRKHDYVTDRAPKEMADIDTILEKHNYYLFSANNGDWTADCMPGKAVTIQIIELSPAQRE